MKVSFRKKLTRKRLRWAGHTERAVGRTLDRESEYPEMRRKTINRTT